MPVAGGKVWVPVVEPPAEPAAAVRLPAEFPLPPLTLAAAGRCLRPGPGLDDDVGELLRVDQPAQGIDGQLELLALGDGLLADLAGGDLQVLLGDGRHDVGGREPQGGQLVGIDPGPQAVVALAEVA